MVSTCGPFRFTSNFDSGNILKTELLENRRSGAGHGIDYEVNLWTRPDCHGTVYENGNRTWFHFGIRGGKASANMKLNILNLNKQVKLFHQGMQPVFRILPERPYWERVPDRLIVNETLDHICSISFRQRLPEDTKNSTLYIAFSYPFSYAELCEWLNRLDTIFVQPLPPEFNFDRIKLPLPKQAESSLVAAAALPVENEIYYHRECACYSLEGRVVELITVSSLYGMSSEREERLMNLFPVTSHQRPYRFPSKKVVFLSARVHPGETPSTFVLNGFFKFVLERNDPRAIVLRRLFVFKFMPMLNPDGVARGHYRTDPRGVNLNRVYLNPSPHLHPSIYAARKLLLYYHLGHDSPDDYDYPTENQPTLEESPVTTLKEEDDETCCLEPSNPACSKTSVQSSSSKVCSADGNANAVKPSSKSNVSIVDSGMSSAENVKSAAGLNSSKYTFVLSDANSLCAGCTISPYEKNKCKTDVRRNDTVDKKKKKKRKGRVGSAVHKKSTQDLASKESAIASSSSSGVSKSDVTSRIMIENEMDSLPGTGSMDPVTMENVDMETDSHQCAFEACDEDSVLYTSEFMSSDAFDGASSPSKMSTQAVQAKAILSEKKEEAGSSNQSLAKHPKAITKSSKGQLGSELFGLTVRKRVQSPDMKLKEKSYRDQKDPCGAPTSLTSRNTYKVQHRFNESPSGLFLYVDMHGHATKRGIFMYGNHFPDAATQAECMLLPRLMAMNCPNFDFAACNFTERLMNMKDRRDGASREGSGRVACLKLTGLVRSYTLECNYNTGRLVNPIVTRPTSFGFSDSPSPVNIHHSPKFTPELFEGSGRALAESVLDLTGHNPWSRLNYTEFKTLEGMGRWLSNRLLHSPEYSQTRRASLTSNLSKDKITPKKSSSSTVIGISPSTPPPRTSTTSIKTTKKRSPKKRTGSKVLVELHPHRAATASSSKRGSETRVPIITPAVISRTTPSRRSSLPNRISCYAGPPTTRTTEPVRRDPPAR